MTTLFLVFKKIESENKKNMTIFIQAQKQKSLSMKVTLMMRFNQSMVTKSL